MIKALLRVFVGSLLVIAVVLGLSFMSLEAAGADSPQQQACEGSGGKWDGNSCTTPDSNRTVTSTLTQVINILIFIVGGVAVIMTVIGGLRYVLAQGDSNAVSAAKNTIIYAIVGVVLAAGAWGIVNFITSQLQ